MIAPSLRELASDALTRRGSSLKYAGVGYS
jgi:hypothetical protein